MENNKKRRRRFGDRRDGRRLRTLTPMAVMIPYIMKVRADSQNKFEDVIDITNIEKYLKKKHSEGYKNMGILHIFIASYVRAIALRPALNRFIAGQHVYSRNNIEGIMTIKKQMSIDSPDTTIKVEFEPTDTAVDVYQKFEKIALEAVSTESSFDKTAHLLAKIPGLILRFTVALLRFLDYFGLLPKALVKVIITSMGSLGINAIYHHLYDFGNLPVFLCYGKKYTDFVMNDEGNLEKHHFVTFKAVTDERICDGYYYASAFKIIKRFLLNPELLDEPVTEVAEDID